MALHCVRRRRRAKNHRRLISMNFESCWWIGGVCAVSAVGVRRMPCHPIHILWGVCCARLNGCPHIGCRITYLSLSYRIMENGRRKKRREYEHRRSSLPCILFIVYCIHYLTPLIELADHFQCNRLHFQLRIAIFHHLRALHLLSSGCRVLPSKIYYLSVGNSFRMYEPAAKIETFFGQKMFAIVIELVNGVKRVN